MTDWLIRITTALAVVAVAVVAAVISYQHAYELVRSHGESGVTARLLPFTVDGLIWAAAGRPTTGTACPKQPSATCKPSPGGGSPNGCVNGTKESGGRISTGGS